MFVRSLRIDGFRGVKATLDLTSPLAVIVGENNSGKSTAIEALRTVLWPSDGPQARRWLAPEDFTHAKDGSRATDKFEIEVILGGLASEDEAALVTCLSPELGDGFARITGRAAIDDRNRIDFQVIGGDSTGAQIDRFAREAVQQVYLPPLRDAARDLAPGRANRVAGLLRTLATDDDRVDMRGILEKTNDLLDAVEAMKTAEGQIETHLAAMVSSRYTLPSDLRFAPAEFEAIIRTLRAHIGEISELPIESTGLGMQNVLFMAVLLSSLSASPDARLTVLLVEEPEAHLHPQLQDLLVRFLEDPAKALKNASDTDPAGAKVTGADVADETEQTASTETVKQPPRIQSVVTSHSPNFAAAAGAERVTVLTPTAEGIVARSPARFGLEKSDLAHLGRYLDVTKAALLFARGVLLVEGIAEQLVVPIIAEHLGMAFPEHGVTVVNVGGLAFGPFVELFGTDTRLPHRCALLTDGDADITDLDGEDPTLSASTKSLQSRVKDWSNVDVFYGTTTFEQELGTVGEWGVLMDALAMIHRNSAKTLRDAPPDSGEGRGKALLNVLEKNRSKGRFAQALATVLQSGSELTPPEYVKNAITFVCGQ